MPCGFAVLARAPRGRRRAWSRRACRRRRRELYQEGLIMPPVRLDDEVVALLLANMRNPDERRGDLRAQIAAHRLAERRLDGAGRAARRSTRSRRRWTSSIATRSASCGRRSTGCRTAATRRSTSSSRSRATLAIPRGGHDRRRRDRDRLRRHVAAARGQPQLPAGGHALGLLLRRPLPDRARPSLLGRRLCAGARQPRPRARSSTPGRRPRSSPATPRRRAASSTSSSRAFGQALPVPAQGQGTMNNVTFGNRGVHVLRDDRRRPGRLPRRRRADRRPRGDVEHAEHARRGARARVPAARRALRAAASGSGGAGAPPRRRRRHPRARACSRTAGSRS